jgi:hypothetical protein
VTGVADFYGIENLIGAFNVDDVFYLMPGGGISGLVDGNGGTGLDEIVNDLAVDTIWTITGSNQGSVAGINGFTDMENLTGGAADDRFVMTDGAGISGAIDGAGQTFFDTIDYSGVTGSVVVDFSTDILIDIEQILGNGVNSELVAADGANTWNIDGANSGTLGSLAFSGFYNLTGGTGTDTFNVSGNGSVGGQVVAEEGNDVLILTLNPILDGSLTFIGGAGDDTLTVTGDSSATDTVTYDNPGAGFEQLTYTDAASSYVLSFNTMETINDEFDAESLIVNGTNGADLVSLGNGRFSVNAAGDINYLNKSMLVVDAGSGNDTVDLFEDVNLTGGQVTFLAENVSAVAGAVLTADTLSLDGVSNVGNSTQSLGTDIAELDINNTSGAIYIENLGDLTLVQFGNVGGQVNLVSQTGNINNTVDIDGTVDLQLTALSGDVNLNNAIQTGQLDIAANNVIIDNGSNALTVNQVEATGGVNLNAQGINLMDDITSAGVSFLDAGTGDIGLQGNFSLTGLASLSALADNVDQRGEISSETGDINLIATGTISMGSASSVNSNTGNISYQAGGNIQLAIAESQNATISLISQNGRITDANGDATNVVADVLQMQANNGIGDGNSIETGVGSLDVLNSGNGSVEIAQSGQVELIALQNTGSNGDITLISDSNIQFYPGSVVAALGSGNLLMNTSHGSYLGLEDGDLNNPDITAQNATFIGFEGTFGSFQRFLTLDVPGDVLIETQGTFNPRFVPPGPASYESQGIDFTVLGAITAVAGEQLIEVESLSDVDPAIFTELKNYSLEEVAIRMPRDQLFEDELEDYERTQ